jgi:MoaA/NifB/PqqE/SkfB family radical SAM enzyme
MIAYAKKFNIHTKLDTNFNVFDGKKAEELINSGLDKIILSIDGAKQDSYQKYRKGGNFNKVLENVKTLVNTRKTLRKNNPVIEWQFLVFKHNEHEMEEAKKIAAELGVDEINFTPPYAGSLEWLTTLESFRSKYYEVTDNKVEFKKAKTDKLCNWLWDGLAVNSDGSVSPCCSVEDAKDDFFTEFSAEDFSSLWTSDKFVEARKHALNSKENPVKDSPNICLRCDHAGLSNHVDIEYLVRKLESQVVGDNR